MVPTERNISRRVCLQRLGLVSTLVALPILMGSSSEAFDFSGLSFVMYHGYQGHPDGNWLLALDAQLQKAGVSERHIARPQMPGGSTPRVEAWRAKADEAYSELPRPVIGVGYSLGGRIILDRLALNPNFRLDGLVLVSTRDLNVHNKRGADINIQHFYEQALDPEMIRQRVEGNTLIVHSKDDGLVKFDDPGPFGNVTPALARSLNAELFTLDGQGHLGDPSVASYLMQVLGPSIVRSRYATR